jgi:hypothetical protein
MYGWPAAGRRHPSRGCWPGLGGVGFRKHIRPCDTENCPPRRARGELRTGAAPADSDRKPAIRAASVQLKILRELLIQNIGAAEGWVRSRFASGRPRHREHRPDEQGASWLRTNRLHRMTGRLLVEYPPRGNWAASGIRTPLALRSVDALSPDLKEVTMQDFFFTHPAVFECGNAS